MTHGKLFVSLQAPSSCCRWHSVSWQPDFCEPVVFAFTAFVGANLLQSALTRWCLMESILQIWCRSQAAEQSRTEHLHASFAQNAQPSIVPDERLGDNPGLRCL